MPSKDKHPLEEEKLEHAYEMGQSAREHGANVINCNFTIFESKESKDAWEDGYHGRPFKG